MNPCLEPLFTFYWIYLAFLTSSFWNEKHLSFIKPILSSSFCNQNYDALLCQTHLLFRGKFYKFLLMFFLLFYLFISVIFHLSLYVLWQVLTGRRKAGKKKEKEGTQWFTNCCTGKNKEDKKKKKTYKNKQNLKKMHMHMKKELHKPTMLLRDGEEKSVIVIIFSRGMFFNHIKTVFKKCSPWAHCSCLKLSQRVIILQTIA